MCINPLRMESRDYQPVPCGKCPECKKRLVHGWAFRLMQEERKADSSLFITLTYDTAHVPITRRGLLSLRKRHLQLFFKRLRKAYSKSAKIPSIRYFACGEYGGRTKRPHYHLILFNADIPQIECAWRLGSIYYGDVNDASIYYVLKYVMKRYGSKFKRKEPEFRCMSKGIGLQYVVNKKFQAWHKADIANRMYCNLPGGKKIGMPRYYKDKLFSAEDREVAAYAGLQIARDRADKDTRTHEQRGEALLAAFFAMEFENKLRCTV